MCQSSLRPKFQLVVQIYLFLNLFQCQSDAYVHVDTARTKLKEDPVLYQSSNVCPQDANWESKPFEPIRIKFFMKNLPNFTAKSLEVIEDIFNDTVDYFRTLLRVRRSRVTLAEQNRCENRGIYPNHSRNEADLCVDNDLLGGVPDADYVFYVSEGKNCDSGTLASANSCGRKSFDERPMFGYTNLCPMAIKTGNWNRETLGCTLRHELLHAMGFNDDGFGHVRMSPNPKVFSNGRRDFYRSWMINSDFTWNYTAKLIVSPKVKKAVRDHFNCSDLEGAELEDEGDSGTQHVHWEKRIFGHEMMTGYVSRTHDFSQITLAFLEDTGWYEANYIRSQNLTFGRNKGCIFARGSCREYMDSLKVNGKEIETRAKPFCSWVDYVKKKQTHSTIRECSDDLRYYTQCDWQEETNQTARNLTLQRFYFADKWAMINGENVSGINLRGRHSVINGCPTWQENIYYEETKGRTGDSVCEHKFSQPKPNGNWGAELHGENSICLQQDGRFELYSCLRAGLTKYRTETAHGAGCYRYKCERGRLMIQANYSLENDPYYDFQRQYKICWGKGSLIQIRRHQRSGDNYAMRYHKGVLICPDCKTLCENKPQWDNSKFKCAKDIRLNSTDFSAIPCPQGTCRHLAGFYQLVIRASIFALLNIFIM